MGLLPNSSSSRLHSGLHCGSLISFLCRSSALNDLDYLFRHPYFMTSKCITRVHHLICVSTSLRGLTGYTAVGETADAAGGALGGDVLTAHVRRAGWRVVWGWRSGSLYFSLNYLIADGAVRGITRAFCAPTRPTCGFLARPMRPLAGAEDLAAMDLI